MINALMMIITDLWHLAGTLTLFLVVGCLAAPVAFGWYHVEKTMEEKNGK
jgi:hypothetical protein